MPIPTDISQLSTTVGLNSPLGTDSPTVLDDIQRAHAAFIAELRDSINASAWVTPAKLAPNAVTAEKLDSTAVIKVLQAAYPVGSIYINAGSAANPSTLLGFGTWVAFGAGRVMVGQNTSDTSFDVLEETGGSKDAAVVAHTHTADAGGVHQHYVVSSEVAAPRQFDSNVNGGNYVSSATGSSTLNETYNLAAANSPANVGLSSSGGDHSHTINSAGVSGTNANLQPYIVVKMWKRTV